MAETDNIYTWISEIINSCEKSEHIEPCEILIDFYQKKGASEDLVKALRVSLQFQVQTIQSAGYAEKQKKEEDKVWHMFELGKYTQKEISDKLGVKILKVQQIITRRMR